MTADAKLTRELADKLQPIMLKAAVDGHALVGYVDLENSIRLLRAWPQPEPTPKEIYEWIERWLHCFPQKAIEDFPMRAHREREQR